MRATFQLDHEMVASEMHITFINEGTVGDSERRPSCPPTFIFLAFQSIDPIFHGAATRLLFNEEGTTYVIQNMCCYFFV